MTNATGLILQAQLQSPSVHLEQLNTLCRVSSSEIADTLSGIQGDKKTASKFERRDKSGEKVTGQRRQIE